MFSIQQIADAVFYAYGISISLYDKEEQKTESLTDTTLDVSLLFQYSGLQWQDEKKTAIVSFNEINCGWGLIRPEEEQRCYLLEPVLLGALTEESVRKYYCAKGVHIKEAHRLAEEYHRIPVVSFAVFWNQFLCLGKLLGVKEIKTVGMETERESMAGHHLNEEEFYQSQQRNFHTARKSEKFMLDCVRRGDVDRLLENDMHALEELTVLGNTELRSMKNTIITAITIITRAAIEGGLAVELAFPLSDMYIVRLENAQTVMEVVQLHRQALFNFTTHVKNAHYKTAYSRKIRECCDYIEQHVKEPLKLTDVAKEVGLHPDYLSRRFQKETGMRVPDYIRRKKIEEAQFQIRHSENNLTEIAFQLGYMTQGRFIEDFKKETGTLPSRYREDQSV